MTDSHPFMDDMLFCGSNKRAKEMGIEDKIASIFKGDSSQTLSPVQVVFEHGVKRMGVPTLYAPQLDYTEGLPRAKVGITFADTGKLEIIKFRLHQISDDNTFFRMMGNKVPFILNLAEGSKFLERQQLPRNEIMPPKVLLELKERSPDIYKYVKILMYNYERAIVSIKVMASKIEPLEEQLDVMRSKAGSIEQLYKTNGYPAYGKWVDAMRNDTRIPQINPRLMNQEYD
jgi:hypothetical protein